MFTWARIPFVRLTLLFMAGIGFGLRVPTCPFPFLLILVSSVALLVILAYFKTRLLLKYNVVYGLSLTVTFLSLGYLTVWLHDSVYDQANILHYPAITAYRGEVRSAPEEKDKSYKILLRLEAVRQDTSWFKARGKVLVYLQKTDNQPEFGDQLLIMGQPRTIASPRNPHEFDYRRYLANKGIYHSHWVDSTDWLVMAEAGGFDLPRQANLTRKYLEKIFEESLAEPGAAGVLKALVLGEKEDLDPETREIFARAGVMHVLAVSGLHVGIIYLILVLIMKPFSGRVSWPWAESSLIVLALWLYAFVTGLPPSVLRAVTMFSILELGRRLGRSSSPFNSLALSAFLLLWIDPFLLTQVGFQLSYVAVAGILLLYKPIFHLFSPKNRVVSFFWQIMALSMAAQIATAPLSIYYFHQFPTYFLVANLLVIPAVTVLVWGGIALLAFGLISISIAKLIGYFLEFILQWLGHALRLLTGLPQATIQNISFDFPDLVLIYLFIGFLSAIIVAGIKPGLKYALLLVTLVFFGRTVFRTFENFAREEIVFYSLNRGSWAIDLVRGGEYIAVADSTLDDRVISYSIQPNRLKSSLVESAVELKVEYLTGIGRVLVWQGRAILIAEACAHDLPQLAQFDFVLQPRHPRFMECYSDQNLLIKLVDQDKFLGHDLHNHACVIPL